MKDVFYQKVCFSKVCFLKRCVFQKVKSVLLSEGVFWNTPF